MTLHLKHTQKKDENTRELVYLEMTQHVYNLCLFRAPNNLLLYKSQVEHSIVSSGPHRPHSRSLVQSDNKGASAKLSLLIRLFAESDEPWMLGKFTLENNYMVLYDVIFYFLLPFLFSRRMKREKQIAIAQKLSLKCFVLANRTAFKTLTAGNLLKNFWFTYKLLTTNLMLAFTWVHLGGYQNVTRCFKTWAVLSMEIFKHYRAV